MEAKAAARSFRPAVIRINAGALATKPPCFTKGRLDSMPDRSNGSPGENRADQRGPHNDAVAPRDLKVRLKEQRLIIEWKDGTQSEYSLDELRRRCPCAACKTERSQQADNPLQILKFNPTDVRVTSASLVGHYAIQFVWSDGHNTGIFDFRFLRSLETTSDRAKGK